MKRVIIGTAGHIDHGKTTLVKALTGINTDRLKEEQKRGISIELGFAPFVLPSGQKAAIVDVPGHERFIKHMLAGAFGIDMVLFVIAADEGIMPQTREHMDIIELLGVKKGIVVLTKKDMVDEEWLLLVEEEVREYVDKTILKGAPIVCVSSVTREGLDELLMEIEKVASEVEEKPAFGHARLPIDRVFSMPGFGTVVTGTLWSGQFNVGDTVELLPSGRQLKIRNMQVHGEKVNTAYAGQRVAVNLQGIEVSDIKRGDWLATPGYLQPSYRVDAKLRLINSTNRVLKNWNRIHFHLGTDEVLGRVVLLNCDELKAGEETYVQIVMEEPVVCHKGDPFVIRYYSPVTTIGGGIIIDANAAKQKRFREDVLQELAMKEEGSPGEMLLYELENNPLQIFSANELAKKTGGLSEDVIQELEKLKFAEKVVEISPKIYISNYGLKVIEEKILENLKVYHRKYPLRQGYPKEDMRSRFFSNINGKVFNQILKIYEDKGSIEVKNNQLMLKGHVPAPSEKEAAIIEKIKAEMRKNLFMPPDISEIKDKFNLSDEQVEEIISYLLEEGFLIKVSSDMIFTAEAVEKGKEILSEYFSREKELTLATARDLFKTTRKYTLPLVEYYDRIRFTRRIGDVRVKL
ncbi:selenocysteine-specific translation elongation factor [Thermosyntropha sp.]|uniref:selenocysteine-specific translation elongation factor n=1 Tax=Thermosyntropha sp. TaxID=2740820 RepID=UPI0025E0A3CC|nr:selenocysteine-specific translation elongation factor [Thermosyntropha sp.]MBO8159664.1 selenocysteine-specific translation elongation factor [Thermosyntropha sp.]